MALTIRDCSRAGSPEITLATRDEVEAWVRAHAVGEARGYTIELGAGDDRIHISFALGGEFAGRFARRREVGSLMYFLEENGEDTGEEVPVRWGEDDQQGALEVSRLGLDRLIEVLAHHLTALDFPEGNWVETRAW